MPASSHPIAPATGKLLVLTPGMGAVGTTFMAGVEAVRKGRALPIGSLTQMQTIRVGARSENKNPLIKDFVGLAKLDDLEFAGWDVMSDNAYEAARRAQVLNPQDLAPLEGFLSNIKPMKAAFESHYVKRLDGPNVKATSSKREMAEALRQDIKNAMKAAGATRAVMIWCGSTEIYLRPAACHASIEAFEKGLDMNDPAISPSQLYAYAAIKEGVPYANGAPNLSADNPALEALAMEMGVPIVGKDFKTGQTLMKTILSPGLKARMLGIDGWFSTNILGNRDGEILDDPESFKAKEVTKSGVLDTILQPEMYPELYRQPLPQGPHQLLPAARRREGGLGQHRYPRLARLQDADQGRLPLPRLDPRGADRARPGAVHGPRQARRVPRHPGVAVVLLQVPARRARPHPGARPVHPAHAPEEHAARARR